MYKRFPLVLAAVVVECSTFALGAEKLDNKQVIDIFEGAIGSIRSYDLVVKTTMRMLIHTEAAPRAKEGGYDGLIRPPRSIRLLRPGEAPVVVRQYSRQIYLKGRGKVERLDGENGKPTKISKYDPVEASSFNVRTAEAFISRSFSSITVDGGDYRETFRRISRGLNLDLREGLKERVKYLKVKEPGVGQPFLVVDAPPVGNIVKGVSYAQWGFRVYLDPRRGMLPSTIEVFQPQGTELRLYRRSTVEKWMDVGGGVWLPIKARTEIFFLDKNNREVNGHVGSEIVLEVDLVRSSWNKEIDSDSLNLPLPAGTRVTDTERGVRYAAGKADPGKNLSDLARNAKHAIPFTPGANPGMALGFTWKPIFAFTFVICVAGGLVWGLLRRSRGTSERSGQ